MALTKKDIENCISENKLIKSFQGNFKQIDLKFEKIDQRFEKIDQRFDKVDQRFDKMDVRMHEFGLNQDELNKKMDIQYDLLLSLTNRFIDTETNSGKIKDHEFRIRTLECIVENKNS